ncbi:hypothetical protein [Halobellus rubicundus]|uniref:Uncharacterized protein n=1 Tax=Halobellus rubicundus TaxID=2996466 RepID=A0ABD5MBE4_9EURY
MSPRTDANPLPHRTDAVDPPGFPTGSESDRPPAARLRSRLASVSGLVAFGCLLVVYVAALAAIGLRRALGGLARWALPTSAR